MNAQLNSGSTLIGIGRLAQADNAERVNKDVRWSHGSVAGPQGSDDLFTSRPLNRATEPPILPPPMSHRFPRLCGQELRIMATVRAAEQAQRQAYQTALRVLAAFYAHEQTQTPSNSPHNSP